MQNKQKKKKPHNKYLALTSLSFQMGIIIYLGAYLGKSLDVQAENEKSYYTALCVLASVIVALYMFVKQAKKIQDD